ncbi:MAG: hypothetical protein AB7N76_08450 [Planctomycetota bacterium]
MSQPAPPFPMERLLQGYTIYRGLLLACYAGFVALGVWAARGPQGLPPQAESMGLAIVALGLGGAALALGSFLAPRRPWAWSLHMALICLGVPLCVTTPFALVMGWTWLHPGVKAHFGVEETPS